MRNNTKLLLSCMTVLFSSSASGFTPHVHSIPRIIKPVKMVNYQDLMEKLPSEKVIEVVDAMPRVVAADVAAQAGVPLSEARKELVALASLSQGDIAVDKDGELIYQFPSNLKATLAKNSAKYKTAAAIRKAWPSLFWFLRASFGVTLLLSVFAIFSTIVFLQSSSSSRSDDDRDGNRRGSMSFGGSYIWGPSPLDFLYWDRPYGYYASPYYQRPDEMGFLPSVFSYVFGDGNPNETIEQKRLALAANMIRANNGAVTAEQLAPFCDDAPDPAEYTVEESFVLPIVTALGGEAQVTEDGEIIYTFPELQTSASQSSAIVPSVDIPKIEESLVLEKAGLPSSATTRQIQRFLNGNGISTAGATERTDLIRILRQKLPPLSESDKEILADAASDSQTDLLAERRYKFSVASDMNKILAGALGVVNLGGALYLGNLLGQYALYGVRLPSYMGVVQKLYPLLLVYAILFNAIPLVRNIWNQRENAKIEKRNQIRKKWRDALKNNVFTRKLKAAAKMGMRLKKLGANPDDIVFDTKKSMEEIKERKMEQELKNFDKLLQDDSKEGFQ